MADVPKMKTLSDEDSSLVSKCLELTKHLANQGKGFKFSLSLPSGFSFSLDMSNEKTSSRIPEKKKISPSTLRRNLQRRKGVSYFRHKDFFHPSITLILPPLISEMGWTGELWSKTNLLNWQN